MKRKTRNKDENTIRIKKEKATEGSYYIYGVVGIFSIVAFYILGWNRPSLSTGVDVMTGAASPFDLFQKTAAAKGWIHSNPVDKLEFEASRFCNIYLDSLEMHRFNSSATKEIEKLLTGQFDFLLNVIKSSTNHEVDLTDIVFHSLESYQQCAFHLAKIRIKDRKNSWITFHELRTDQHAKILSYPLREMIKIRKDQLKTSNFSHISLDIYREIGRGKRDLLSLSVLYGMIDITYEIQSLIYLDAVLTNDTWSYFPASSFCDAIANRDSMTLTLLVQFWNQYFSIANHSSPCFSHLLRRYEDLHFGTQVQNISLPLLLSAGWTPLSISDSQYPLSVNDIESPLQILEDQSFVSSQVLDRNECGYCNIQRVEYSNLTLEQFHSFVISGTPVAIHMKDFEIFNFSQWTLPSLLAIQGEVVTGPIPYSQLFGLEERLDSLPEYQAYLQAYESRNQDLHNESDWTISFGPSEGASEDKVIKIAQFYRHHQSEWPRYLFLRKVLNESLISINRENESENGIENETDSLLATQDFLSSFLKKYKILSQLWQSKFQSFVQDMAAMKSDPTLHFQFYLGPALSGAPFHVHGPALNFLLSGRKRWNLRPPSHYLYTNIHPLAWESKFRSKSNISMTQDEECIFYQKPHEILLVPRHWSHQVLNLDQSIGFAMEIQDYV